MGFPELTPLSEYDLFKSRPPENAFDFVVDEHFRPVRDLYPSVYQGYEDDAVVFLHDAGSGLPNGVSCDLVSEANRRAWCHESGYTINITADTGPGVLVTEPFDVVGRHGAELRINWAKPLNDMPETIHFRMWHPLFVELYDSNGVLVVSGPDATLDVSVKAFHVNASNPSQQLSPATMCDPAVSHTIRLSGGVRQLMHAVCDWSEAVVIEFTVNTTQGVALTATTIPFEITRKAHSCGRG